MLLGSPKQLIICPPRYMTLIAAHVRLISDVCRPIYHDQFESGHYPPQHKLAERYTTEFPWITVTSRGQWVDPDEIEYVKGCAMTPNKGIWHKEHGIAAFFSRRGVKLEKSVLGKLGVSDADQCELFWWLLMLRGTVWTMSCKQYEGDYPVPPIFYGNKTPIWIT